MQELKIKGIYKHFKGDYYLVEDIVKYSETKEEMVLYRQLYGDNSLWVRPKEMFLFEQAFSEVKNGTNYGDDDEQRKKKEEQYERESKKRQDDDESEFLYGQPRIRQRPH